MFRRALIVASIFCSNLLWAIPPPPSFISINFITPTGEIFSGDTFRIVIRISGSDILPEKIGIQDIYPLAPSLPQPFFMIGDSIAPVKSRTDTASFLTCNFADGVDTIKIVLFEASADLPHKLYLRIGSAEASTDKFLVRPRNFFCKIAIETLDGTLDNDTLFLPIGRSAILQLIGFDYWGNRIGLANADWRCTGILPPAENPEIPTFISSFYFEAGQTPKTGYIIATTKDSTMSDSIFVVISSTAIHTDMLHRQNHNQSAPMPQRHYDLTGRRIDPAHKTVAGKRIVKTPGGTQGRPLIILR